MPLKPLEVCVQEGQEDKQTTETANPAVKMRLAEDVWKHAQGHAKPSIQIPWTYSLGIALWKKCYC